MASIRALVIGSTGMIGNYLVEELIKDDTFSAVTLLVRKPVQWNHPKINIVLVDFNNIAQLSAVIPEGDVVFCCIGTTQKNVNGDKALYYKIDHDIPVHVGQIAKEKGYSTYCIVSAVGANAKAGNFYLKLKGDVEQSLAAISFNSLNIFQPSMLLGQREEKRPTEKILQSVFKGLSALFVGGLRKYRGIEGKDVARAMTQAAKLQQPGQHVYEYIEMMKLVTD